MIDQETATPMQVSIDGTAGPYLIVPLAQLPQVQGVLDQHRISYSVAEDAIELDGKPVIAIVNFGLQANARILQEILDAA